MKPSKLTHNGKLKKKGIKAWKARKPRIDKETALVRSIAADWDYSKGAP